jgi:DNA-binding MarR family transcriptional regulator
MQQQALGSAITEFHHLYWPRIATLMAGAFEENFTKAQFTVLGIVAARGSIAMSALAEHTGILKQQMTRIVDQLEDRGYVRRERSTRDRRSVDVYVTEQAKAYLADFEVRIVQRIVTSIQPLTDSQRQQLLDSFDTINTLLQKLPIPEDM